MELWSLLSITAPGLFPSPTRFREMYARPIERDRDAEVLARLRRRIRPLMRRRTKEQVAPELPRKQEQELEVELDARHRRIYERHLQRERQKVLGLIDDVDRNRFTILRSITLLRRLSLHPGLVADEHAQLGSAKIDTLLEQLVRGGRRRPPGAGVQPVHELPRARPGAARRRRGRLLLPRRVQPRPRGDRRPVPRRRRPRSS